MNRYSHQQRISNELVALRSCDRYKDLKKLTRFGYKIYSQCDEDGIIHEIFNRIGITTKIFVEFGVDDGLENNSLALLLEGFSGLWIEASSTSVQKIIKGFPTICRDGRLQVINKFVTTENIDTIIASGIHHSEVDLLSVDIDGNEIHIINAIKCINPRVVVIEYNAKFPPPINYCMRYDENFKWRGDDCLGASLKYLDIKMNELGYKLVGCSLSGVNAFFIRKDLVENKFSQPYSAENHYEPPRYYLTGHTSGYPPSYQTIEKAIVIN